MKTLNLMTASLLLFGVSCYANPPESHGYYAGTCTMVDENVFPSVGEFLGVDQGLNTLGTAAHLPKCVKSFKPLSKDSAEIVFTRNGQDFHFFAKLSHVTKVPTDLCFPVHIVDSLDYYDYSLAELQQSLDTIPYIQQIQFISGPNNSFSYLHYEKIQVVKTPVGTGIEQRIEYKVNSVDSYVCD